MRIITFDEIPNHYEFMKLMHAAFGWAESAERTARWRRYDVRYKHPYGFALEWGTRLLGFVGTIDLPVRIREGKTETVGGIHSVATDPDCSRSGVATRLLEHAHDYFRRQGYRYSLLCTSRSLVAHALYKRLGYSEIAVLARFPRAYRSYPEKKKRERKSKKRGRLDSVRIMRIFDQALAGYTGCAVRPKNWPQVWLRNREVKPENVIVLDDGYAFTNSWGGTMFVDEIVALNRAAYVGLLERLRKRGKSAIVVTHVWNPALQQILKAKGYSLFYGRYGVRMAKPLTAAAFEPAFGERFCFSPLDAF
jgi:GNAT superfamily N-acetyltransferase